MQCSRACLRQDTLRTWQFFQSSSLEVDPVSLVSCLKDTLHRFKATPVCLQQQHNFHVESTCTHTHVFVHNDAIRKPLQPPNDGPYVVLGMINMSH